MHFAYETGETTGEDRMNTAYLQETCRQAGYDTELIAMSQIGWDTLADRMVFRDRHLDVVFALYPWEWMWHEEGGRPIFRDLADPMKHGTVWIEPPYTAALWATRACCPCCGTSSGTIRTREVPPPGVFRRREAGGPHVVRAEAPVGPGGRLHATGAGR